MLVSDCCVSDISDVLESKEQTNKTHPHNHHHVIEKYQKVWLIFCIQSQLSIIVRHISSRRLIGHIPHILIQIQNRLHLRHNPNIHIQNIDQIKVYNHSYDQSSPELNDDSTLSGVSPDSKLHRVVWNVLDVFTSEESSGGFLVDDAVVPVEEEVVVGRGGEDKVVSGVRTSPDFEDDVFCESAF